MHNGVPQLWTALEEKCAAQITAFVHEANPAAALSSAAAAAAAPAVDPTDAIFGLYVLVVVGVVWQELSCLGGESG